MSEPRTIKKYPNRRLYDTEESRYITLADIRRLVLEKVDFIVIDNRRQVVEGLGIDAAELARRVCRRRHLPYLVSAFCCAGRPKLMKRFGNLIFSERKQLGQNLL